MKIKYMLNSNNTIRSYWFSNDPTAIEIGDDVPRIGVDQVIGGSFVRASDAEYAAYLERIRAGKRQEQYERAVVSKIRAHYTQDQELAILRQRDEKRDEYDEYYAFCEACKQAAKRETVNED